MAQTRNCGGGRRSVWARGLEGKSGGRATLRLRSGQAALQRKTRAAPGLVPFRIFGKLERAEGWQGVAIGAVGEPGERGTHAEPAEAANELPDFEVGVEKAPLAEEDRPVTDVA